MFWEAIPNSEAIRGALTTGRQSTKSLILQAVALRRTLTRSSRPPVAVGEGMHGFELGVCEGGMGDDRHIVTVDEGDEVVDRGGNAAVVWRDADSSVWPEVASADPPRADMGAQGVASSLSGGSGESTSAPRWRFGWVAYRLRPGASVCAIPLCVKHRFSVLGQGAPVLDLAESVSKLNA